MAEYTGFSVREMEELFFTESSFLAFNLNDSGELTVSVDRGSKPEDEFIIRFRNKLEAQVWLARHFSGHHPNIKNETIQ